MRALIHSMVSSGEIHRSASGSLSGGSTRAVWARHPDGMSVPAVAGQTREIPDDSNSTPHGSHYYFRRGYDHRRIRHRHKLKWLHGTRYSGLGAVCAQ